MPVSKKKVHKPPGITKLAHTLSPNNKLPFCVSVRVGRRTRQMVCYATSALGAKRIAGRFYREMYSDRAVNIVSVSEV
jgi:hypothetical protein